MRILCLAAFVAALTLTACATTARTQSTPSEASGSAADARGRRDRVEEWTTRTGTIWLEGQPCAAFTANELAAAQAALDECARALQRRVVERLDGRGDSAAVTALATGAALASGGTITVNFWTGVAAAPVLYEQLQSQRMTSVEFFAGYGVSWIRQRSNDLEEGFAALARRRAALATSIGESETAIAAVHGMLECANLEIAGMRDSHPMYGQCRDHLASTEPARTTTRDELTRLLADLQRAQTVARQALLETDAVLERRNELPTWIEERFTELRYFALGQQLVLRVGPEEALREIIAFPFVAIANTINAGGSSRLEQELLANKLQRDVSEVAGAMGFTPSALVIDPNITFDRAKISNTARASAVAVRVATVRTMLENARAAIGAIAELKRIDELAFTAITLPTR